MKKVSLKIGERLVILSILNQKKGTLETLNLALKITDKIAVLQEEREKVGLVSTGNQITWKDTDYEKEIELSDEQFTLLVSSIEEKDKKADWAMDEVRTVTPLKEKLEEAKKQE